MVTPTVRLVQVLTAIGKGRCHLSQNLATVKEKPSHREDVLPRCELFARAGRSVDSVSDKLVLTSAHLFLSVLPLP